MHAAADFDDFTAIIRKMCVMFGKKASDELVTSYWDALKDLHLPVVRRCAENHARYGKFFPKPIELRPKDETPASVKEDKAFKAAVEQNIRNWDERLRLDPIGGRRALLAAYGKRAELEDPSSVIYAEKMEFIQHARRKIDAMERGEIPIP